MRFLKGFFVDSYKESEGGDDILKHLYKDPSWNSMGILQGFKKDSEASLNKSIRISSKIL